jgi:hypothetical protein
MSSTARFVGLTALIAIATWAIGWWAVAVVAVVAVVIGTRPTLFAAASSAGWGLLLVIDAVTGGVAPIAHVLAGVMGVPAPLLYLLTLLFPALLGWSAAVVLRAAKAPLSS